MTRFYPSLNEFVAAAARVYSSLAGEFVAVADARVYPSLDGEFVAAADTAGVHPWRSLGGEFVAADVAGANPSRTLADAARTTYSVYHIPWLACCTFRDAFIDI